MTNAGKHLLYRVYSWGVYAVPMLIMWLANQETFGSTGSTVGMFGILVIALLLLAFRKEVLNLLKTRTLLTGSVALLVVAILMRVIADNLLMIAIVSCIGAAMQSSIEVVANVYERYAYIVNDDGIRVRNPAPALSDADAWREAYGLPARSVEDEGDG